MVSPTRRQLLATSGGTLAIGGLLASLGTTGAEEHSEDGSSAATESNDWPSHRGNAANNAYFPDRSGPEAPVAVAWERDGGGPIAVVDGTIYQAVDESVHALNADDGSVEWESDDVGASDVQTPATAEETVYVSGEDLTALDADDGSVRWEAGLESDDDVTSPTVVDDTVLVVADGELHALDADTGDERWQFEADGELFDVPVTAADGGAFVHSSQHTFACELEDGSERWTIEVPESMDAYVGHESLVAGDGFVAVPVHDGESPYANDIVFYETDTGDEHEWYGGTVAAAITEDRFYANPTYDAAAYDRETTEQVWDPEQNIKHAQRPVVAADGIYLGIDASDEGGDADEEHGLYVFEPDGSVKWSFVDEDSLGLDATLVEGTVYAQGRDQLLALRSESEIEDDEQEEEESTEDEEEETEDGDEESSDDGDDEQEEEESTEDDDKESDSEEKTAEETDDESDDTTDDSESDDADDSGEESDGEEAAEDDVGADDTDDTVEDDDDTDDGIDDGIDDAETEGGNDDDADVEDDQLDDVASDDSDDSTGDDSVPGFTTGAGVVGGAVTLEWLRRKAATDEPKE